MRAGSKPKATYKAHGSTTKTKLPLQAFALTAEQVAHALTHAERQTLTDEQLAEALQLATPEGLQYRCCKKCDKVIEADPLFVIDLEGVVWQLIERCDRGRACCNRSSPGSCLPCKGPTDKTEIKKGPTQHLQWANAEVQVLGKVDSGKREQLQAKYGSLGLTVVS